MKKTDREEESKQEKRLVPGKFLYWPLSQNRDSAENPQRKNCLWRRKEKMRSTKRCHQLSGQLLAKSRLKILMRRK